MPAEFASDAAVAIFAPLASDAKRMAELVEAEGHPARTCQTPDEFFAALQDHPACAVITEEGAGEEVSRVVDRHSAEAPLWSTIPLIFVVNDPDRPPPACRKLAEKAPSASMAILQRPFRVATFVSVLACQTQLRERQFETARLIDRLEQAESYQRFLLDELRHRTRNMLGVLQATVKLSGKNSEDVGEFQEALTDRLMSISLAHSRLANVESDGAGLRAIVKDHVAPFCLKPAQLILEGPDLPIPEKLAFDLAMVIHELATNAAKYGPLSSDEGTLSVSWREEDGALCLHWLERGGPLVVEPEKKSFGTTMIEQMVAKYGGEITLDYQGEGLAADMRLPLPQSD